MHMKMEEHTRVILLIANVENPRNPFMINPARIHLISEIPDPAAYLAMERTRWAAVKENVVWGIDVNQCNVYGYYVRVGLTAKRT